MQDFYDALLDRYYSPPYDANSTYAPSAIVKFNHLITRSTYSEEGNYHDKALYAPVIMCCLGLSALMIFCLALMCRRCYEYCRCRIPRKKHRRTPDDKVNNLGCLMKDTKTVNLSKKVRRWSNCVFYSFTIFFLMAVQLVYLSNAVFDGAMNQLSDSGQLVTAKVNGIVAEATQLQQVDRALALNYALALAQDPRCEDSLPEVEGAELIAALNSSLHRLGDSIDNITASSLPVNRDVERAESFLYEESDDYSSAQESLEIYLLCLWSVCVMSGLGLIGAKLYGSMKGMKVAVGFGAFVELLLIGGGLFYLWLVSVGADVCMDPARHVPDILREHTHRQTANLIGHYMVCGDADHVLGNVPASATSLQDQNVTLLWNVAVSSHVGNYSAQLLEQIIDMGSSACKDNTYLLEMKQLLQVNVTTSVRDLDELTACGASYNDVSAIFERTMCGYLYLSVAEVWVAQLVSALCLFISLVASSIAWQYYDHRHIHRVMLTPREGFTDDDDESETLSPRWIKDSAAVEGSNKKNNSSMVLPFDSDGDGDGEGETDMMFDVGSAPRSYHHHIVSGNSSAAKVHPSTGGNGRAGGKGGPPPALMQQQFNTRRVHEVTHSINITKSNDGADDDLEDYDPNDAGGSGYL